MRDPKIVLKHLSSLKEDQSVTNIYKNLYNPEFYKIAYQNLYSKPGQMTQASNGSTIDGMSEERINKLIQSLRDKTYKPTPLKRINISNKSGKIRSVNIPSFDDKLVQEIIKMLLEALYEPQFLDCSHGYRPNRSCHTTLKYVQQKFQGNKWWITIDIKGCFDNINHVILLNLIKKRIREQKFIHLINLFLKAGYIENWRYDKTYSGVPQGTIIGPILSNIYLHELDKYMMEQVDLIKSGRVRKSNNEYHRVVCGISRAKKSIKNEQNVENNVELLKKYKLEFKRVKKLGALNYNDPEYRRLAYVRYSDDIIIGSVSSKKEAEEILNNIKLFLLNNLKLELSNEKTKIVHNSEQISFLGYNISVIQDRINTKYNGNICLWLPYEVMKKFIIDNRFGKFVCDSKTGKPKLKGIHRPELINLEEYEILMQYNAKIKGLYNYYKMASNVCKMANFNYVCQLSFLRTLAAKYKTTCAKLYANKNYNRRHNGGSHIGIVYNGKFYEFFNGPFNVVKTVKYEKNIDIIENINKYFSRTSLIQRLEAKKCEFCGDENGPFEVHHVKKIKDLKGKASWEKLMISRKRKTMVLCKDCHHKLHAGKL